MMMDLVYALLTCLRFAAFLGAVAGYVFLLKALFQTPTRIAWAVALCSLGLITFVGGLVGLLLPVALGSMAVGLCLALFFLLRRRSRAPLGRSTFNLLHLGFASMVLALIGCLYDAQLVHPGNFSHWGPVLKYMLLQNRFPDAAAALAFPAYPLGISSFLYLFCTVVGHQEGVMLIGQMLLLMACFFCVFAVVRDTRRALILAVLGLCLTTTIYFSPSAHLFNLPVDFLVPVMALAALSLLMAGRQDLRKTVGYLIPILGLLGVSHFSGLFYLALCLLCLLFRSLWAEKKRFFTALGVGALSLLPCLAWYLHLREGFGPDQTHALLHLPALQALLAGQFPEGTQALWQAFWARTLDITSINALAVIFLNGMALLAVLLARWTRKDHWKLLRCVLLADLATAAYLLCLFLMYLTALPPQEALALPQYDRYVASILVFGLGVFGMALTRDLEYSFSVVGRSREMLAFRSRLSKTVYQYLTLGIFCVVAFFLVSTVNLLLEEKEQQRGSLPARVKAAVGDQWTPEDAARYLVVGADPEDQGLAEISRYYLGAQDVTAASTATDADLAGYDWLVVIDAAALADHPSWRDLSPGVYPARDLLSSEGDAAQP